MGRNNYSYNGLISVITRKPVYRYKSITKATQEVVNEVIESGNLRKVNNVANINSLLFSVPEVYSEYNDTNSEIDLIESSNVSTNQDATYSESEVFSSEGARSIITASGHVLPLDPQIYTFDAIGADITLVSNTMIYTNTYTTTSILGANPEIIIKTGDVVIFNVFLQGAIMNVYSDTSIGITPWDSLTTHVNSGTITVAPTSNDFSFWANNNVYYASGKTRGKITVVPSSEL